MSDYPRFTINRCAIVLVPQQPFLDWILAVDPEPIETLTLQDVRDDESVFLVPAEFSDSTDHAVQWVEQRWHQFFEFMLGEWFTDELWPDTLSLDMFRAWFTVQFHSSVWDMAPETEVMHEDWEEDDDEDEAPSFLH